MFKILITGGAGFIGSHLAERLIVNPNYFVVSIDNLSTGCRENIPSIFPNNYQFIECDVNNHEHLSDIMLAYKFDYVFHYAAVVGVARTLDYPLLVLQDIEGIKNVLNLSKNTGVKRVFFSSSSEVYGEPVEFPQNEHTTPLNSKIPYAIVKNIGEAFLKSYKKEYNLDYTIFRFFNTYGSKQSADFVISKFIKLALSNKDITIYGDGLQTRTFCFIEDNLEATIRILNDDLVINDVINFGSDIEMTILDLAKLVIDKTNSKSKIIHLPALKEGDMTRRKPDNTKMKQILQGELLPLSDGIDRILELFNK
ncbi:UDP-glucose 4-epimerase [Arcicella aurantiaca]|uniref:UDP-glucose 4-epimerase n=1 Tax=Arcicella aurantiaca TaxID=591202 RepID=A0A316DTY5_9BACT|nr:NAD-dependent epimerase/dehydratase family protein [Arcicella aurantiaca]PWK21425.1 UDP-glucose 4-epimerase [Arcicella aurantiaca]